MIGRKAKETVSETHIYVLVNIKNSIKSGESIEYFIVPSKQLAKGGYHKGNWPNIEREKIISCRDKWSAFGKSE